MALLLLLSTISWKVEKHYCMGRLMDMAVFLDVDDCGMNMTGLEEDQNLTKSENSCCSDEIIFIEGQDDLKVSFNDLETEQQFFLVVFVNAYQAVIESRALRFFPYEQYPPPQLFKDIQLLDQVFLI